MKSIKATILFLVFPVLPHLFAGTITYPITTNVMITLTSWDFPSSVQYATTQISINGADAKAISPFNTDRSSWTNPITLSSGSLTIKFTFSISCSTPPCATESYTTSAILTNGTASGSITASVSSASGSLQYTVNLCPTPPYLKFPDTRNCYNQNIDIKAMARQDYNDTTMISYKWDYHIGTTGVWKSLGTTSGTASTIHFNPKNDSSEIKGLTRFYFRTVADDNHSGCIGLNSYAYGITDVLPPPPTAIFDTIGKSCPGNVPTGQIKITNIKSPVSTNAFTWRITDASMPDLTDIYNDTSSYSLLPVRFTFDGSPYSISNIPPGEKKLYLVYQDSTLNNCLSPERFTIDAFPQSSYTVTKTDCTCPEKTNGTITLTDIKGAGSCTYYLDGSAVINPFTGLSAKNYIISMTDVCTTKKETLRQDVSIIAPPAVTIIDVLANKPNCLAPTNGGFAIEAYCESNTYNYRIYRGADTLSNPIINIPAQGSKWHIDTLSAGNYIVNVRNNNLSNCAGALVSQVLLPVDTLKTRFSHIDMVKCFGTNSGLLTDTAWGGQKNRYTFHLTNLTGLANDQNGGNLITFNNLPAGLYTIEVKNANSTCNDIAIVTDSIKSNKIVKIDLNTHQDITCHGDGNGNISPVLSGGSNFFGHDWYKWDQDNENWHLISLNSPLLLTSLKDGNYRLSAWDSINHCDPVYDSVAINEPAPLVIDSVKVNDIACLGESGNIKIYASGGNLGNKTYQDSTITNTWQTYTTGTALQPATYYLRVRDIKNCTTNWPTPQAITTPVSKFDFSDTLSNYNGKQVSCYGNYDGWIKIVPWGGNGGSYSGYQCTIDDTWHSTDSLLANLYAGSYSLSVKDARGCTITRPVVLNQADSKLTLSFANQKPTCYTDTTGVITAKAGGGAGSYTYRIGTNPYDTTRSFTRLPGGMYLVIAKDLNGCTKDSSIDLSSRSPQLFINGTVQNVKCNGQNNGSVLPLVTGGTTPYAWLWKGVRENQFEQHSLAKGTYAINIIDALNCEMQHECQITEPPVLMLSATTKPVCVDAANGLIYPKGSGGTPPYKYSLSQSTGFTLNNEIPAGAGTYNVFVSDSNNCINQAQATVETRNIKPWVDFLVATSRYATDSLEVIDISWPLPDSTKWIFAPEARVISNNTNSVCIKFDAPGQYPITMTGYFSGCDYSRQTMLTIAPYDPDAYATGKSLTGFETANVVPNPNSGLFKVNYKLYPKQKVYFKVVDMYSNIWYTGLSEPTLGGEQSIQIPNAPSGTYILMLICDDDAKAVRFIITK